MWSWKGLGVTLVTAGVLSIPMYFYWDFLTRGMRPPEATRILNELEKTGIPNFTLNDMAGKPVSLEDFRGKIVLVNIWATWCAPCVKEFPSLKNLVEKFNGEIVVLAISHDRAQEDIESFVRAFGKIPKDFVLLWDKEKAVSKIFGTEALPETYIISPTGKLLRKVAGDTIWDDAMATEFFKDMILKHTAKAGDVSGGDPGVQMNLPHGHPVVDMSDPAKKPEAESTEGELQKSGRTKGKIETH